MNGTLFSLVLYLARKREWSWINLLGRTQIKMAIKYWSNMMHARRQQQYFSTFVRTCWRRTHPVPILSARTLRFWLEDCRFRVCPYRLRPDRTSKVSIIWWKKTEQIAIQSRTLYTRLTLIPHSPRMRRFQVPLTPFAKGVTWQHRDLVLGDNEQIIRLKYNNATVKFCCTWMFGRSCATTLYLYPNSIIPATHHAESGDHNTSRWELLHHQTRYNGRGFDQWKHLFGGYDYLTLIWLVQV